jgi:DNA-binding response OmpR family regulator
MQVETIPMPARRMRSRPSKQLRIVLAEDDYEMRRLLCDALRREGHDVIEAKNGSELLERVETELRHHAGLNAVITDVCMPGFTGLQALDWLQRVRSLHVPLIVITAFGDRRVREQARRLGADLLEKPFDLDELRARIRKIPLACG